MQSSALSAYAKRLEPQARQDTTLLIFACQGAMKFPRLATGTEDEDAAANAVIAALGLPEQEVDAIREQALWVRQAAMRYLMTEDEELAEELWAGWSVEQLSDVYWFLCAVTCFDLEDLREEDEDILEMLELARDWMAQESNLTDDLVETLSKRAKEAHKHLLQMDRYRGNIALNDNDVPLRSG